MSNNRSGRLETGLNEMIHCSFKRLMSHEAGDILHRNIVKIIQPNQIDPTGLVTCSTGYDSRCPMTFKREEVNRIRDSLDKLLSDTCAGVLFHITTLPFHSLLPRSLEVQSSEIAPISSLKVSCYFGSLRSHSEFYTHESFNNKLLKVEIGLIRKVASEIRIQAPNDLSIIIPFSSIQLRNIVVDKSKTNRGVFILFSLKHAPRIFKSETSTGDAAAANQQTRKFRVCFDEDKKDLIGNISKSSDMVLFFPPNETTPWTFLTDMVQSRDDRFHINFGVFEVHDWSDVKKRDANPDPFRYGTASFAVRYGLQMLTSMGYVFRDKWAQLSNTALGWNRCPEDSCYDLCCFVFQKLQKDHGYDLRQAVADFEIHKREIIKERQAITSTVEIEQEKQLKVACATLTPLRTTFEPLEKTTGNRAIRHQGFGGPNSFLLVHLREEGNEDLRVSSSSIKDYLKKKMLDGIVSLGKTYTFMGASTGQLKEMSFWFLDLSATTYSSIDEAREALGDFRSIKNIATYIARVGQYFSNTWPIGISLTKVDKSAKAEKLETLGHVFEIPDHESNGYCFTDGIGKISLGLAALTAWKMKINLNSLEDIPSAFQIRVAGCKGMVAIDPTSTLDDYYIQVRPSMIKFQSDDWDLEICDISRPLTLTFNNQVIRLLSDLGNPYDRFSSYQQEALRNWHVAQDSDGSIIDIALKKNFSYAKSIISVMKNQIPIPPQEGRVLFGVVDETGELKYGQCFIQYSKIDSSHRSRERFCVVNGHVLVTKNPCLWPGDFRRLQAVPNAKLKACMRDVIVFPKDGPRPHSNEISGSDLDGDQYWVYWGTSLQIKTDVPPLDYQGAEKAKTSGINQGKVVEHIVETFGASGIIGMIANTHTVAAEKNEKHSFSNDCKKLAELFALAVDSPKTGKIIKKDEIMSYQRAYCSSWPQYMGKMNEPIFETDSTMERLFLTGIEVYFSQKESPTVYYYSPQFGRTNERTPTSVKDASLRKWLENIPTIEPKLMKKREIQSASLDEGTDANRVRRTHKSANTKGKNLEARRTTPRRKGEEKGVGRDESDSSSEDDLPRPDGPKKTVGRKKTVEPKKSIRDGDSEDEIPTRPDFVNPPIPSRQDANNCIVNFFMGANNGAAKLQFTLDHDNLHTIHYSSKSLEQPTLEVIATKLAKLMEKNVFKKTKGEYRFEQDGSYYLSISYGCLYVENMDSFPDKLSALHNRVEESTVSFEFIAGASDKLNIRPRDTSATSKTDFVYEFWCFSNSQKFILYFDSSRSLQQISKLREWSKFYIRQPDLATDSLAEIQSLVNFRPNTEQFQEFLNLIFEPSAKTTINFLTGRQGNISVNYSILKSSITPIKLKIIEHYREEESSAAEARSIFRFGKYSSIKSRSMRLEFIPFVEYQHYPLKTKIPDLEAAIQQGLIPFER